MGETYKTALVIVELDDVRGTVTITHRKTALKQLRDASPRVLPVGAIERVDVKGGLTPRVTLVLRTPPVTPVPAKHDPDAFIPSSWSSPKKLIAALEAAVAAADPILDFDADAASRLRKESVSAQRSAAWSETAASEVEEVKRPVVPKKKGLLATFLDNENNAW